MASTPMFEAWLSTITGTEFTTSALPDANEWWKLTFKVPDQVSFDRVMTHLLNNRGPGNRLKVHLQAAGLPFRTKGIRFPLNRWDGYSIVGEGTGATLELVNDRTSNNYLY